MLWLNRAIWIVVIATFGFVTAAQAEVDPIPPTTVPPGPDGVTLLFPNALVPPPHYKVFRFTGEADAGSATVPTPFTVLFDWLDPTGGPAFSPPFEFVLEPLVTTLLDTGEFTLPFCPQQVSLHFLNGGTTPAVVKGMFLHECRPIPEPAGLTTLAGICLFFAWSARRFRGKRG